MSMLRPPGLGPIIGHTTDTGCRLWIQAGKLDEDAGPMSPISANRRTLGVIGVMSGKDAETATILKAYYFRLHREFDRTGTFFLGVDVPLGLHANDGIPPSKREKPYTLKPDTEYTVRMATLSLDDPLEDADSLSDVQLRERLPDIEKIAPLLLKLREKECQVSFWTFPPASKQADQLSFLLGSCRYPGLLWKIKEADRIFGPMQDHFFDKNGKPDARFTLMVGDQIYADMLHRFVPVGLADTYEEFQERYQTAFGSRNMRVLLKRAPTYMILDDHEIEDNWSQDRLRDNARHRLFNLAIGAYMSYQWSHGPRTYGRMLYYSFECAGYPFFVLDTRTQRFKDDKAGLDDNHLLGRPPIDKSNPGQLGCLLRWLSEQQKIRKDAPKFVVTSSVFAPNDMGERTHDDKDPKADIMTANRERREKSDSWPAYPCTRQSILEHILAQKIQNVVFLTGDIHCCNIARITIATPDGKDTGLCAYDITSSAFYWPFPFADGDPNNYVHDSTAPNQLDPFPFKGGVMNYRSWGFAQEDNFARIDIDRAKNRLTVRFFNRDGDVLEVLDSNDRKVTENVLPLA